MAINVFRWKSSERVSSVKSQEWDFRKEWDEARASAMSPADLAEIDAMFARYDAERSASSQGA